MSAQGNTTSILAALGANLAVGVAKFAAWLLTSSSSMLAEAIHSVADSGNELVLLLGGRSSRRKADRDHPFGYGAARYLSAFLVAIILFSVGGLFALYEAYEKYRHPQGITGAWWWVPLAVILFAMLAEGLSLRTAVRHSARARGRRGLLGFVRAAKSPELPVVLLEDSAALLGLSFALFGVGMTILTGDGIYDALGTAAIGVLLVVIALVLAIETRSLLLGEAASEQNITLIERLVQEAGARLVQLRTMHLGPEDLLVAARIELPDVHDARQLAEQLAKLEERITDALALRAVVYLQPVTNNQPPRTGSNSS